jgi:ubiquinone/menaquinone biosynthesis C-methylase UbiE
MAPIDSSRYDLRYSHRSIDLRVPGDALKDLAIFKVIKKTDHRNKRLLDLGCGMGHTSARLSSLVHVVGLDFSKEALKVARDEVGSVFVRGDAQALPFQDNAFDYVIAKDLLEHVPDDVGVLREILRVCKPQARLIMYLPCDLGGFNLSAESLVKKLTGYTIDPDVGHLRRYTVGSARQLLQTNGFQCLKTWYAVHFSLGIAALLSVTSYKFISAGKKQGEKLVSRRMAWLVKAVFGLFEIAGRVETFFLKGLPGAGFFIQAQVNRSMLQTREIPSACRFSRSTSSPRKENDDASDDSHH